MKTATPTPSNLKSATPTPPLQQKATPTPPFQQKATPTPQPCFKECIYSSAVEAFGVERSSGKNWDSENETVLIPHIENKRNGRIELIRNPNSLTKDRLDYTKRREKFKECQGSVQMTTG